MRRDLVRRLQRLETSWVLEELPTMVIITGVKQDYTPGQRIIITGQYEPAGLSIYQVQAVNSETASPERGVLCEDQCRMEELLQGLHDQNKLAYRAAMTRGNPAM